MEAGGRYMEALVVNDHDHRMYLSEVKTPDFKENEVLVKIKATAVNRADLLQKRGNYPPPEGASKILGLEASGVIEQVGSGVTNWQAGDRVCMLLPGGGYAEYAAVPEGMLMAIPESLDFEEAAAIPEVFFTAYMNLFWKGRYHSDETILIHAGASGVGTAAIQLVKEAGGTSIITAGSESKREFCRSLGASETLDYKAGPFAPEVKNFTDSKGVDLIFDFIGADYWDQNLDSLAVDGRLVIIGTMGGRKVKEADLGMILGKRLQVIGTALRSQTPENKVKLTQEFAREALPKFERGTLRPIVDSVWEWTEVNEAHKHMEANKNTGKIVLKLP